MNCQSGLDASYESKHNSMSVQRNGTKKEEKYQDKANFKRKIEIRDEVKFLVWIHRSDIWIRNWTDSDSKSYISAFSSCSVYSTHHHFTPTSREANTASVTLIVFPCVFFYDFSTLAACLWSLSC